jgi:hypothetical protein
MLPHFRPAVYKCILPVEKPLTTSSTVYHSPLDDPFSKMAQSLPFPAWPEIDDPYRPCYLPLLKAVYFSHRRLRAESESEEVKAAIEEYLSRLEVINHELTEQVIALAKSPSCPLPQGTSDHVFEAVMRAKLYGTLKNFYGEEDVFAYPHEFAHRATPLLHIGFILDELSIRAHETLDRIATEKLTRKQTAGLWAQFVQTNEQITHLTQKFEPIEEIFATYIGLRYSPTEVRNKIEAFVKHTLEEKNWDTAYQSFEETCDTCQVSTPQRAAFVIFARVCLMLEQVDIDSAYLLDKVSEIYKIIWSHMKIKGQENHINQDALEMEAIKKTNSILEQAGIPIEVFYSVYTADLFNPQLRRLYESSNNNFSPDEDQTLLFNPLSPLVFLFGRVSRKEIIAHVCDVASQQVFNNTYARIFYESQSQQLRRHCGIVCAFAYNNRGGPCCGLKYKLHRLYECLPKEDKKYFKEPNCDLIR